MGTRQAWAKKGVSTREMLRDNGFDTLVIWENELKDMTKVTQRIEDFEQGNTNRQTTNRKQEKC